MKVTFVGFDSAWADNPKTLGAICSIDYDGESFSNFHEPALVGFKEAQEFIAGVRQEDGLMLIAIDQPTVVPNQKGMRLIERVAASAISWLDGGRVQPAYRDRKEMFGDDAPIWKFLKEIGAQQDPIGFRLAHKGSFLIEVYPALALPALNQTFCDRGRGPRYNPANRKRFRCEDWTKVILTVSAKANNASCKELVSWCEKLVKVENPVKKDQDMLDATICLLVAICWKLDEPGSSIMIGDLEQGYMVSPIVDVIRRRLEAKAAVLAVKIDGVIPSANQKD